MEITDFIIRDARPSLNNLRHLMVKAVNEARNSQEKLTWLGDMLAEAQLDIVAGNLLSELGTEQDTGSYNSAPYLVKELVRQSSNARSFTGVNTQVVSDLNDVLGIVAVFESLLGGSAAPVVVSARQVLPANIEVEFNDPIDDLLGLVNFNLRIFDAAETTELSLHLLQTATKLNSTTLTMVGQSNYQPPIGAPLPGDAIAQLEYSTGQTNAIVGSNGVAVVDFTQNVIPFNVNGL